MMPSTPHWPKSAISRGSFTVHTFTFTPVACPAFTSSGVTYVRLGCRAQRRMPRALSISDDRSGESAKMNARRTAGPATRHPSSAAHQKLETYASGSRRSARSLLDVHAQLAAAEVEHLLERQLQVWARPVVGDQKTPVVGEPHIRLDLVAPELKRLRERFDRVLGRMSLGPAMAYPAHGPSVPHPYGA